MNNSKLNETKDQFFSTKHSHSEPVMMPKLHASHIFKGHAYELKYRAYGFSLNKQQLENFTLISQSNFFKTRKNYYIHSECIKKTQPVNSLSADLSLHCRDARHLSLFQIFLWCSLTNNAWSHYINERNHNNKGAKWSVANTDLSLKVQDAIISDVIVYPEMDISWTNSNVSF